MLLVIQLEASTVARQPHAAHTRTRTKEFGTAAIRGRETQVDGCVGFRL
jgi:hypothetical protein